MWSDPTWHVLAPLAFGVGAIMIVLGCWRGRRRDESRWGRQTPDERDWHRCFMRDVRDTPRSWR